MPTSNTKPQQSAATDSPLGAPGGNEPYKTVRMKNMAQEDGQDVAASNSAYDTKRMGNIAGDANSSPSPEPKPAQGA